MKRAKIVTPVAPSSHNGCHDRVVPFRVNNLACAVWLQWGGAIACEGPRSA